MQTYKCDSCGKIISQPYEEKMKEFYVGCEFDECGVFPIFSKQKVKIHLCEDCYKGLHLIAGKKRRNKQMTITRNECCDCAVPAYPCRGEKCPLQNQKVYICDKCKDEVDELYEFDGQELCIDCIKKRLKVVE